MRVPRAQSSFRRSKRAAPAVREKRSFLMGLVVIAAIVAVWDGADCSAADERPNVLWIVSDDVSPDFGCYGDPLAKTPHVDQLAREGVRFNRAYTTAPVCSASRSAFFTGMYQTTIGAHNHRSHRGDGFRLPDGIGTIMDYFRSGGYFTVSLADNELGTNGKTDYNFELDMTFDGKDWSERAAGQPFFAYANIKEPHRGFVKPSDVAEPVDPDKVVPPPYYPNVPLVREDWAAYLNSIEVLDQKVGRVLAKLANEGLAENTIVFFFGDHGRPHIRGKQFLYEGGIRVPLIVRWPASPNIVRPGRIAEALVSAIDIPATSLKLAGIEPPESMQGQVFLGSDTERRTMIFAARDRCDGTVDRIRAVRNFRYKYIRNFMPERAYTQLNAYKERSYPVLGLMRELKAAGKLTQGQAHFMAETRPREELYDLQVDPYEMHNLALDTTYRQPLRRMGRLLDEWIAETDDQGAQPEDPEVVRREFETMKAKHEAALRSR